MNSNYLDNYGPLLLMFIIAAGLAGALIMASAFVGRHKRSREKDQPYECGITPDRRRAGSHFPSISTWWRCYLFCSISRRFFSIPGRSFTTICEVFGFVEMLLYIVILLVGYIYPLEEGRARLESLSAPIRNRTHSGTAGTGKTLVVQKLREWDAQAVAEVIEFRGETTVVVPRENLRRVAEFWRPSLPCGFTFLSDITSVDRFPHRAALRSELPPAFDRAPGPLAAEGARCRGTSRWLRR